MTRAKSIQAARAVVTKLDLADGNSAGGVGAAILTRDGNGYTGGCIDLASEFGFCADVSAIAQLVTNRETRIATVVAVTFDRILPPYGRCREPMVQIDRRNLDCTPIVGEAEDASLRDLLPSQ